MSCMCVAQSVLKDKSNVSFYKRCRRNTFPSFFYCGEFLVDPADVYVRPHVVEYCAHGKGKISLLTEI